MADKAPGGIILEPNEHVIMATRPLFLWEPLVVIDILLIVGALYFSAPRAGELNSTQMDVIAGVCLIAFVVLLLWLFFRWLPWSRKWFVLTDRRVIASWGVVNRNQAALLLDRMQDVSLSRPFPLSMIRDYGTIHVESAGKESGERISGGLDELDMTHASAFYRALTDAQTKN
ncbi:MAG TPA: PH domain-containing protein [Candidatus Acidoferrales bacterium]|nr:PH domain-containing protein [Candidatus Acidoferrales bacterium]